MKRLLALLLLLLFAFDAGAQKFRSTCNACRSGCPHLCNFGTYLPLQPETPPPPPKPAITYPRAYFDGLKAYLSRDYNTAAAQLTNAYLVSSDDNREEILRRLKQARVKYAEQLDWEGRKWVHHREFDRAHASFEAASAMAWWGGARLTQRADHYETRKRQAAVLQQGPVLPLYLAENMSLLDELIVGSADGTRSRIRATSSALREVSSALRQLAPEQRDYWTSYEKAKKLEPIIESALRILAIQWVVSLPPGYTNDLQRELLAKESADLLKHAMKELAGVVLAAMTEELKILAPFVWKQKADRSEIEKVIREMAQFLREMESDAYQDLNEPELLAQILVRDHRVYLHHEPGSAMEQLQTINAQKFWR